MPAPWARISGTSTASIEPTTPTAPNSTVTPSVMAPQPISDSPSARPARRGVARAAVLAEREGTAAGLRDAALLSLMSDALLRVSEASAADVADVARMADGSGTLTVLRSKTDQEGRGHVRYLGPATIARIAAYLDRAGHHAGALFRRVRRGDHPAPACPAASPATPSASAPPSPSPPPAPARPSCARPATGSTPPCRHAILGTRPPLAAPSLGSVTGCRVPCRRSPRRVDLHVGAC